MHTPEYDAADRAYEIAALRDEVERARNNADNERVRGDDLAAEIARLTRERDALRAGLIEASASYTHARQLCGLEPDIKATARWRAALQPAADAGEPGND